MQTLEELREGKLQGVKRLTLAEDLNHFPLEILTLSDTLEILDLSNNKLTNIPEEITQLSKLKIAFFSNNLFTHFPSSFKKCPKLYMLGFKANQIEHFPEDVLPLDLSWLIITDNKIKALPHSLGKLHKLQKFSTAGNQLTSLPEEMANCHNLELLRISANKLTHIPSWLSTLPKLSWLAFSGNPCSIKVEANLPELDYKTLDVKELLGEGASGKIFKGHAKTLGHDVAIKVFKGDVTSDGYAIDEMHAYMSTGEHPHLIKVLAKISGSNPLGLVLELIPASYENLGFPPNFQTCTRDTFKEGTIFDIETIYNIAKAMISASAHLHNKGLMHGDLYAHNILIHKQQLHTYLGDFGAASFYDRENKNFEKIEVRALGCLLDDLLQRCKENTSDTYQLLQKLSLTCMSEQVSSRPLFSEIVL